MCETVDQTQFLKTFSQKIKLFSLCCYESLVADIATTSFEFKLEFKRSRIWSVTKGHVLNLHSVI